MTRDGPHRRERALVVAVSAFPVHPRTFGGQLRAFHLARQLASLVDVRFVSLTEPRMPSGHHDLGGGVTETVVAKSREQHELERDASGRARAEVGDILAATLTEQTPEYGAVLAGATAGASAVLLAGPWLLPSVRSASPDVRVVYDAHNAELRHKRSVLPESTERARLLDLVHDVEGQACAEAVLVGAPLERDVDALCEDYGTPRQQVLVVPNAADVDGIPFTTGDERRRRRRRWLDHAGVVRRGDERALVLFIGSNHAPNVEAAEWLVDLAGRMPDSTFVVAGGVCEAYGRAALPDNMLVAGWISDRVKQALLASATVALNPIRSGYGSNVKAPECLAAGLPLITTPFGARGLPLVGGAHATICELDDFERAIAGLRADPSGADAIASCGRALADTTFSWAAVTREWCDRVAAIVRA